MIFRLAVPTLSSGKTDRRADLIGTVAEKEAGRGRSIRVWGKCLRVYISCTYVIEIVSPGEPIEHLECNIETFIQSIFYTCSYRNAQRHGAVLFAVGVKRTALALCSKLPQIIFFTAEIRKRIITENAKTQCYVWCKAVFRFTRQKTKEVEIALQCQLPHIGVEAEITAIHIFILCIVLIGVAETRIRSADAGCDVIIEIFAEEERTSHFGPVHPCAGIKIAEIVRGAKTNAKFTFLNDRVLSLGTAG